MAPVIRDWFRTRRQLVADRDALEVIVAKQVNEIAGLRRQANASRAAADEWVRQLQSGIGIANDQVRRLTAERDDLRQQNIRVRNALQVLREDIRRAEEIEHPPTAGGTGMVRPLAQRNPMADRILRRPWPADLADVLAQETVAKQLSDGEGDE